MVEILYQEDNLVAVNKPAGLLMHRSFLASDADEFLLQIVRDQIGQYVYPVHRLDRPTSGIVLFSLTKETAANLKIAFDNGHIHKTYLAIVRGYIESQIVDHALPVIYDEFGDKHKKMGKPAQQAVSEITMLSCQEFSFISTPRYPTSRYALVKISPKTGRRHQLRRHLKHIYHPIIGDTTYGDLRQNKAFAENIGVSRLMLHATEIELTHPETRQEIHIKAGFDSSWCKVLSVF